MKNFRFLSIFIFCSLLIASLLFGIKYPQKQLPVEKNKPKNYTLAKDIKFNRDKEIAFGQSAFLSEGPLKLYSSLIRNAIHARFKRENEAGGIQSKQLRLISMDDKDKPEVCEENIKTMMRKGIDTFIGNVGVRGILKVLPLIQNKKIAMLFPWGGDEKLRQSDLTNIVNGLGLIEPQAKKLVEYAVDELHLDKIAIFNSDGYYEIENEKIIISKLKEKKIEPVATASYNRFTMDISAHAKKLIEADPKLVICLSTSKPTIKLINKFFVAGHYGTQFIGIDSNLFVPTIMKRRGVKFAYSSPMPNPQKSNLIIVKMFREDMKKYFPDDPINILSLSYYIHASIIIEAMKKITGEITKEKIIGQIEDMQDFDLLGFKVNFNDENRYAYEHKIEILES